jgi:N-acetylmuramoyl-L-alanine amidase
MEGCFEIIYFIPNVTLAECGFLSNNKEAKLLIDNEYQNKIAKSIHSGIMNYFEQ